VKCTAQDAVRAIHTRDPTQNGLTSLANCLSTCLIAVNILFLVNIYYYSLLG
jgi:hypothetical protein